MSVVDVHGAAEENAGHDRTIGRQAWPRNIALILLACVLAPLAIAYGFGNHDEVQVVAVIIGVVCTIFGLTYPFCGLIIFVALLYVRPEETIPALNGMHFTLIFSLVASISVVVQKLLDREAPVKLAVNGLIVCFAGILVLSTVRHGGFGAALLDASKLVALVLIICNLVRTPARFRALSTAVVVVTVYLALFSVVHYYTGLAYNRGGVLQATATGIFGDPNDLSATIVAGLGLALCRAVAEKGIGRALWVISAALMVWGVYLTNSRGGILALVGTLAAFALIYSRSRWVAMVLVVALGAGAIKFGPSRMKELDTQEESANSRFRFWHIGTANFISNPLTGIGYGQFPEINNGMTAHNSFVLCYTELGFPGYLCWMGCLYYSFRGLRRKAASATTNPDPPRPQASQRRTRVPNGRAYRPPGRSTEWHDSVGSRLALGGFLMAAFWISRTYVPVLYLLMSLPLAQQIAYSGGQSDFGLTPAEQWRDACIIVGLCIVSILFIWLLAERLMG